jgi:hypothetical protein
MACPLHGFGTALARNRWRKIVVVAVVGLGAAAGCLVRAARPSSDAELAADLLE